MTAVGESDPNLASKCLDFCQALSSQGVAFNFSLSIGSTFSFSLDTRGKAPMSSGTKKKSPSTLRRNARRRKEFLEKKQNPVAVIPSEVVEAKVFKCEQCENVYKSENGLKIHVGKTHKNVNTTPPPPDRLRQQQGSPASMPSSPLLDASREEVEEEKEEPPPSPPPGSLYSMKPCPGWEAGCRCERCVYWQRAAEAIGYK